MTTFGRDYLFALARQPPAPRAALSASSWRAQRQPEHRQTGKPARRFKGFTYATRDSWSRSRRVIGKAEHLDKGANPRFIVTSLEECCARTLYEKVYCARGEMENRIKECQLDLFADRTSTATLAANQLRLWFSSFAYVLLRRCAASLCRTPNWCRPPRQHQLEAPQTRRSGNGLGQAHQDRHRLGLPAPGRLRPRPCPTARDPRRSRAGRPPPRAGDVRPRQTRSQLRSRPASPYRHNAKQLRRGAPDRLHRHPRTPVQSALTGSR